MPSYWTEDLGLIDRLSPATHDTALETRIQGPACLTAQDARLDAGPRLLNDPLLAGDLLRIGLDLIKSA